MCGIVGAWFKDKRAERINIVKRSTAALTHRGPDDYGVVEITPTQDGTSLVFGHRRLSIIDLSEAGHQPMRDAETGNWIIYNGEVYNFLELRLELETHGCRFQSNCDTEVLLQSYRIWGRECVKRWRGMFTAAIWDARRQELFLVRDRLGIKPLYYSYISGQFVFASELRALLATDLVPRKIDLEALNSFLMFGAVQDPVTLIKGVMSLPAAHTLVVNKSGIQLQEYWDLPLDSITDAEEKSLAEGLNERLAEAVRLHLVSDVPLGVFLSGGVDSSALAMLMRCGSPDQVKSFTIGFHSEAYDEATQAKQTALQLGIEHHAIFLTEVDMLASFEAAVEALDQPSIDGINTFHISRAVRQAGITVALSGLGSDEAFCGYSHFRTVPRMERFARGWANVPTALRNVGDLFLTNSRSNRINKLRALLRNDYGFAHPYFLARTLFLPSQVDTLLDPEVRLASDGGAWMARLQQMMIRTKDLDPINRISYFELKTYVANTLLRDTDVMSMAHSLEVRVPFLDHLLLEDVMRLPGNIKLDRNIPKPLLVRSLPEDLPKGVTTGPKRGFTLPFADWLPGQLRATVEESFAHPPSALDGIVNAESVQKVWHSFLTKECSWTPPWALYILYRVVERLFSPDNMTSPHITDTVVHVTS